MSALAEPCPKARPAPAPDLCPPIRFDSQPVIETARLRLRRPDIGDSGAIAAGLSDFAVARMLLPLPQPYHPGDALDWLLGWRDGQFRGWSHAVTLRGGGALIGVVSLEWRDGRLALGYWLHRRHWRQGIMSEAVSAVLARLFEAAPGLVVHSAVIADNPASLKLQDRLGFAITGVTDAWCRPRSAMVSLIVTELRRENFTPV